MLSLVAEQHGVNLPTNLVDIVNQARPILDASERIVFIKDVSSSFVYCNHRFVDFTRLGGSQDILGHSDIDLPWAINHQIYRKIDQMILTGVSKKFLMDVPVASGKIMTAYQKKTPIVANDNEILGILVEMQEALVQHENIYRRITDIDEDVIRQMEEGVPKQYLLERYIKYGLTERESECLFYLIRGKTIKKIARKMGISPRTVEKYLILLKDKFNCHTKSELIDKVYKDGTFCVLPPKVDFEFLQEE